MTVEPRPRPRHSAPFAGALLLSSLLLLALAGCRGASRASSAPAKDSWPPEAAESAPAATAAPATTVTSSDGDADGIPDAAELHTHNDRENFRRWFTGIAEQQFYEPSKEWNAEQRDCAGLVRFAWREALRRHDRRWLARMGAGYEAFAPDVRAYTLDGGLLGERLFRTTFGPFRETDLRDDTFAEFADARTLKNFNAEFVGRDRREARPGDLVFFHQPWAQRYPYHVMIFVGPARSEPDSEYDWVVYHTGNSATDKGEVRKLRLAVLDHHPDRRWRPVAHNRNFLGFYRLKILQ
jgi:uncharacterized protein YfaT (DUF1175 family)